MLEDCMHAQIVWSHLCIQTRYTAQNNCFHCPPLFPAETHTHSHTHTHTVINRCAPLEDLPPYPDMHMELPSTHSQMHQLHKAQRSMRSLLFLTSPPQRHYWISRVTVDTLVHYYKSGGTSRRILSEKVITPFVWNHRRGISPEAGARRGIRMFEFHERGEEALKSVPSLVPLSPSVRF